MDYAKKKKTHELEGELVRPCAIMIWPGHVSDKTATATRPDGGQPFEWPMARFAAIAWRVRGVFNTCPDRGHEYSWKPVAPNA
jgi:hypothetical protein